MKKVLIPLLTLLLVLFVAGCSTNSPSNKSTRPKDEDPEFGVSTQQLIEDISKNETIADCLSSKFIEDTPVEYVSHEITKRKIDEADKTDVVYCTINAKEEYLSAKIDAKLSYSFYDVGGWVLGSVSIEDYTLTPLKAADAEMIISEAKTILDPHTLNSYHLQYHNSSATWESNICCYLSEDGLTKGQIGSDLSYYTRNFKMLENEFLPDMQETRLHISLTSSCIDIFGYFPLGFHPKNGWDWKTSFYGVDNKYYQPAIILTDATFDSYQSLVRPYNDGSGLAGYRTLKINEIDVSNMEISYTIYDYSKIGADVQIYNYTTDFHPLSSEFECHVGFFDLYIQYDPTFNSWVRDNKFGSTDYLFQ